MGSGTDILPTEALQDLLSVDGAEYLSINYDDAGNCYAIASIDDEGDEIAVYEGVDLPAAWCAEADALPKRPDPEFGAIAWPYKED